MKKGQKTGQVTMTRIAEEAGVSQATVSRVLNGRTGIRPEVREKVMGVLRRIGYKNSLTGTLTGENIPGRLELILCPLPEQKELFRLEYFAGIAAAVRRAMPNGDRLRIRNASEWMRDSATKGLLLLGSPSAGFRETLKQEKIPFVVISCDQTPESDEDFVGPENFHAGRTVCRRLLERGFRRIGVLLSPHNSERLAGIRCELESAGLSLRDCDCKIAPDTRIDSFGECVRQWQTDLPPALFVSSYTAADAVEILFAQRGLQIPRDLFLCTVDHRAKKAMTRPALRLNTETLGRRATLRMMEKLRFPDDPPSHILVPMPFEDP